MSTVPSVVNAQLEVVRQLCREHHVRRLELFGSATGDQFDIAGSDLDFLVEFESLEPRDRADAYFGLLAALQDQFGRQIDLVEVEAIQNPYFQRSVNARRTLIYAA